MSWKIKVDPLYSRVPWNEKTFNSREELEKYLKYFGIDKVYHGPGFYSLSEDGMYLQVIFN